MLGGVAMQNFIMTQDKATINFLKKIGFKEVSHNNNVAFFINQKIYSFSEKEKDKYKFTYTNILPM